MKYDASNLLIHPRIGSTETGIVTQVTAESAGWQDLNFEVRRLNRDMTWTHHTGDNEYGLVILGGICTVQSNRGSWHEIGRRPNVFSGMPYAVYLPRQTEFTLTAHTDGFEVAAGWAATNRDRTARLITPADCTVEIRGGGSATRQIVNPIPVGFECDRLIGVEVYTPGGNWSSYPPHKHDVHRTDASGNILEADLDEIYYYKIDRPDGYAIQRVYTPDGRIDALMLCRTDDTVLVPEGYHPVSAAHGYTTYYLNFLAGSAQSLANVDDPAHAWIKSTWKDRDPRIPIVSLTPEESRPSR
jgi:5-deoxy-glucuronate isomerase